MATFNINTIGSFATGTAAGDSFNLNADKCTVLGLDGDDKFSSPDAIVYLSLDGGAGIVSFSRVLPHELSHAAATAMMRCSSLPAA